MITPLLLATDLSRTYRRGTELVHALDHVSLSIPEGEFVCIWGPSGSGKSTLLSILGLADVPTGGTLAIDDKIVAFDDQSALTRTRRKTIGFVFQAFHLVATLTARENVAFPLLLNGKEAKESFDRAANLLSDLGMSDRGDHFPSELSGGEMQRVAVARALIHEPRYIIADEPTGNLDSGSGAAVLDLLSTFHSRGGTVILASHSSIARQRASMVLELRDGRVSP